MTGIQLKLAGVGKDKTAQVTSLDCTVHDLRHSIAQSLGSSNPAALKLIVGGRTLVDDSKSLEDYGVKESSRITVLGVQSAAAQADLSRQEAAARQAEERDTRLHRLRTAAAMLAKRSADSGIGTERHYDLSLENQAGEAVVLDAADREALVMGLSLADKGHRTMEQGSYRDALEELLLAEEAFDSCTSSIVDSVDNAALLKLDIVWCFFQMRDVGNLGAARARLAAARAGLGHAHGPNLERLKVLHGNFSPELATYVRLELLEGVAAYHAGNSAEAAAKLDAARLKWHRLQVADDQLAALLGMGFGANEAKRALRFCRGDVEACVGFVMEQRAAAAQRKARAREEKELRKEQSKYGRTAQGAKVDMHLLQRLASLDYERPLAAEALRQTNNDAQLALDVLSNPMTNSALQQHLAGKSARHRPSGAAVDEADVARLVSMGCAEAQAREALQQAAAAGNTPDLVEAAMQRILGGPEAGTGTSSNGDAAGPSSSGTPQANGQPSQEPPADDRDAEMEEEITGAVRRDPLAAYDVDVALEGAAIDQYFALLQQQQQQQQASGKA